MGMNINYKAVEVVHEAVAVDHEAVAATVAHEAVAAVAHEAIAVARMEASVSDSSGMINIAQGGKKDIDCRGTDEKMPMKAEDEESGDVDPEATQAPSVYDAPPGISLNTFKMGW